MEHKWYQELEDKKILIIGGAGFVGSNLAKQILKNVFRVQIIIIDNLLSAELINVPIDERVQFIEGSITDFRILANIRDEFDYIFHLATYHGNQSSIFDPIKDHENNTMTTLMLFERIKDFKQLKKVVYSSAGCSVAKKTFDEAIATTEDAPVGLEQDSPYSISKIIGEFYSVYYHKQCNVPVVRARFQNVYGPGEILGAGNWRGTYATVWRNVTPTFVYKALMGQEIPLENAGIATRDFIFVEDICRGLLLCAIRGVEGSVYNLASGAETTIEMLAASIIAKTNTQATIKLLPKREWDNSGKRFASTEKAKAELGFSAEVPLEEGLSKTIEWTQDNIEIIQKCMDKHSDHLKYR